MSRGALSWARDGQDWPNRECSRFVEAGGLTWHVQVKGQGPVLLLLHGTGASTHSWRDLLPRLAERFTVVAPDLPGHAFTSTAPSESMSLAGMAASVSSLLRRLELTPSLAVGNSAGAAVAIWMTFEHLIEPAGIVSLNGALLPIGGLAGQVFAPLARVLASSHSAASLFTWWAGDEATVSRLLAQTGSRLDPRGLAFYHRLASSDAHVRATLAMMANWNLKQLEWRLPTLTVPLVLVVGTKDGTIPPSDAEKIRRRVGTATIEKFRGLGHLAHEEDPVATAELIARYATDWGVIAH